MKIEYKIATHDAEVGDVVDMDDLIANVLIILGYAVKTRKKPSSQNGQDGGQQPPPPADGQQPPPPTSDQQPDVIGWELDE